MAKNKGKEKDSEVVKETKVAGPVDIKSLFTKEYGKSSVMSSDTILDTQFVIPSSSVGLNLLLGCGGAPSGRILEFFGPEGGCKTFLALDFAVNCQKMGKSVCFVDVEQALDIFWAKKLGIDENKFVWLRPNSGEEAFDMIDTAIRSGQFGLVILDSVAELTPAEELEGKLLDVKNRMGLVAKMMSVGLRKITAYASKMSTSIIFVNQVRDNIGVTYGNPEVTPGGRALKFYSSIRLRVNKVGKFVGKLAYYANKADAVKAEDTIIGQQINVGVEKNKMAAPVFQKAEFYMHYNSGIDKDLELINIGVDMELLSKVHGKELYTYGDQTIDLTNRELDPVLYEELKQKIYDKVKQEKEAVVLPTTTPVVEKEIEL